MYMDAVSEVSLLDNEPWVILEVEDAKPTLISPNNVEDKTSIVSVAVSRDPRDYRYLPPELTATIPRAGIVTPRSEEVKTLLQMFA